jgi:chromatin segregation and condensation protein Rec8/ScpA/Scc1 (kleisin family)
MVATLELVRLRGVLAEQSRPFAEIYLRPGDRRLTANEMRDEEHSSD